MEKAIVIKNLKFWGTHSAINATPSFIIAYIHDWNSAESVIAMIFGVIIFTGFLTFITSLPNTHQLLEKHLMKAIIRAGTITRSILCLLPIPLFILSFLWGALVYRDYTLTEDISAFYIADFISGIFSHTFYRFFVDAMPFHISDIRGFAPTLTITIVQGFILTGMMALIGLVLSPIALMCRKH